MRQDQQFHNVQKQLIKTGLMIRCIEKNYKNGKPRSTIDGESSQENITTFQHISAPVTSNSLVKKRKREQRKGTIYQERQDIDNFLDKIDDLEAKLREKSHKPLPLTAVNEKRGRELSSIILQKLEMIHDHYTQKTEELQENLSKITNKYEIINEQISILNRKIDKYKAQQLQTNDLLRHLEEKKVNERVIEQIKTNIKILAKQMDQNVNSKVNKEVHQHDVKSLKEKIRYAISISDDKSEKSELKKLSNFFEEKIKDIIIVLAQEKNFNKDSATKKIPIKCLSCDKDLEPTAEETPNVQVHRSVRSSLNSSTSRLYTNQIKKRGRLANNCLSGQIETLK